MPISLTCMALSVRRIGYHQWLKIEQSGVRQVHRAKDDQLLTNLKTIKAKNKKYGVLRLLRGLSASSNTSKRPSYGKVYRLCKDNGLLQKNTQSQKLNQIRP